MDFLFELGCEELPSGSVRLLSESLAKNLEEALKKAELPFCTIKSFATPRRIACLVEGLGAVQASQKIVKRGPSMAAAYDAKGNPTAALHGFLKSCTIQVEDLTIHETDKGAWLVYEKDIPGSRADVVLPGVMQEIIGILPITKPMRWAEGEHSFSRPVHWVLMLLDETVLPCEILGVQTGRHTYGHRFHAPGALEITHPKTYETRLESAFVIADFSKRKECIEGQINRCAEAYAAKVRLDSSLLEEVTAIVEWPCSLVCKFDKAFLSVPAEALIAAMQIHQKCFALQDAEDRLLPYFITISNIESKQSEHIVAGNEKVMHARLSDAAFFYEQDKKKPFTYFQEATHAVIFQQKLGTLFDKAQRMSHILATLLAPLSLDEKAVERVTLWCKWDLMTGMVGEFPELQGIMGTYYARYHQETEAVAIALQEQYLPRFAKDILPQSSLGVALSLADRLDTLVGIFAIGQKPTGMKDPFKLRRHALAIARILIHNAAPLTLDKLIATAAASYEGLSISSEILNDVYSFIFERLQSYYQSQGITPDLLQAVKAKQAYWLYDFDRRLKALAVFIQQPESAKLCAACKRVAHLLEQASFQERDINKQLLQEKAECDLYYQLIEIQEIVEPLYLKGDYTSILGHLASLGRAVDAFFDTVMVIVEEKSIKDNRLALLKQLQCLLQGVADITLLQPRVVSYHE